VLLEALFFLFPVTKFVGPDLKAKLKSLLKGVGFGWTAKYF